MADTVVVENRGGLRIISYNNPAKRNAIRRDAYPYFAKALNDAATDDSVVVVAITGKGNFFTAGADLTGNLETNDPRELVIARAKSNLSLMVRAYINFPKLLIAVVNGPCIGIGATTAALCDIVYASEKAYFLTPFTMLGLCAEACSSYTFPKIFGTSKAAEMLLTNYKMSAQEALEYNFVSEIFKDDELDSKIWPRIEKFAKLPKESMQVTKSLIKHNEVEVLDRVMVREIEALEKRWESEEFMNAIVQFMNRKSKI